MMFLMYLVSGALGSFLSPAVLKETDRLLAKSCGGECVNTFRAILPQLERLLDNTTDYKSFLSGFEENKKVTELFLETEKMRTQIASAFVGSPPTNMTAMMTTMNQTIALHNQTISDGTPCATTAACLALEQSLNFCSSTRQMMLTVYESLNRIVGSLASTLQVSCVCVFQGPVSVCALARFPYTCASWFQIYRSAFMYSLGVWNGAVAFTSKCMAPPVVLS